MVDNSAEGRDQGGDVHSDAALYAVDALEVEEARAFEAHLTICSRCQEEVDSFRVTAEGLAEAVAVEPPAELKTQVLGAVHRESRRGTDSGRAPTGQTAAEPEPGSQARVFPLGTARPRRSRWLLAAAAVILVPGLALGGWSLGHQAGQDSQQVTADQQHQQQQQQRQDELLTAPDVAVKHVSKDGASATVVTSRERTAAMFVGSNFTDPGHGKQYQLWLMKDGAPVPDTTFNGGDSSVWLTGDVRDAEAVAVTVEPEGGSQTPTSDVMMAAEI
ncbi:MULTISPECIES: anti-sigma factor [Micrococcaceae]|uniref:anti-sigma factor n=1 Tax=unclassified Kocuria TaxID=2649579 RepID=UPI0013EDC0B2|nr:MULTISPECIES: anti-sigma factor [unclassified Kocuria]